MSLPGSKSLRPWLDLARAGNFPSVVSNALAALVLASTVVPSWPPAGLFALAALAGCLIYAGGATFYAVADTTFDAQRRPERAIPRGAVTRSGAAWVAAGEMLAGLAILASLGALLRLTRLRAPATLPLLGAGFHHRSDKRIVR